MRVPYMDIEAQYMEAPHRRVVDLRSDGLPEIPMLGMYSYSRARPDLPVHRHAGGWEICFLERGNQTFEVQGQVYRLRGGDVFVTFPDEPHSTGGSLSEPGVLYWLNLRLPAVRQRLLALPRAEADALVAALTNLPHRHFRAPSPTKSLFKELFRWHDGPAGPGRTLRMRLTVTRLLLEIVDAAERRAKSPSSERITEIICLIRSHPERDFGLEDLARHARLSLSHFKKRFRAETGLSPRQFILRDKMEAAKHILSTQDKSVTHIALDLGFVSSQYFATVFKRITGVTPSLYRERAGEPAASPCNNDGQTGQRVIL
ncbi:MAG: helix-turn-helix transcriptional regulator [Pirellulaceae bacterium]